MVGVVSTGHVGGGLRAVGRVNGVDPHPAVGVAHYSAGTPERPAEAEGCPDLLPDR